MSRIFAFLHERPAYIWLLSALPVIQAFTYAFAPGRAIFKGHSIGVVTFYIGLTVALILWLPYRRQRKLNGIAQSFFVIALAAWVYQVTRTQLDQSNVEIFAFGMPVAIALVMTKPPRSRDASISLLVLAWTVIFASIASLVADRLGLMDAWLQSGTDNFNTRLLILSDWFGLQSRWNGPWGNPNLSGPMGSFLLVMGVGLKGWYRWIFAASGVLILVVAQGRTDVFAAVIAVGLVLLWTPTVDRLRHKWAVRAASVVGLFVVAATFTLTVDGSIGGRTPIWSDFSNLWTSQPIWGAGTRRILEFQERQVAVGIRGYSDAHNVLLDGLFRNGLVMAGFGLALFVLALASTIGQLRVPRPLPMALVTLVIMLGMTETLHSWSYWTFYFVLLSLAVLQSDDSQAIRAGSVTI